MVISRYQRSAAAAVTAVTLVAVFPSMAGAYIDPTSGGLLLQFLLGGIAGVAVIIKLTWHRFRGFFNRKSKREEEI